MGMNNLPKPYFQDEYVTIYHSDCREILPLLPEHSVVLALLDPPWFISQEVVIHRSMNPKKYNWKYRGKDIDLDFGEWDKFASEEEYLAFTRGWFTQCVRVLRESGHLVTFFDLMRITHLVELARELDCIPRQVLFWLKTNPVPRARCVDFMVSLEAAPWFTKGTKSRSKATFNYQLGQQPNYVPAPIPGHTTGADGARSHPTQKPVKVLSAWINYLSNIGDVVLDPFLGSGATAVAAKNLRRKCIGIEIDEAYAELAAKRCLQGVLELEV